MGGNQFSMVQYSFDIQHIENILVFLNIQCEVKSARWWYGCLECQKRVFENQLFQNLASVGNIQKIV